MKADLIVKNAKIYTEDDKKPWAEALAVKDGKFIYVGSDEGVEEYEGETIDAQGKFITPALLESHIHIAFSTSSADTVIEDEITGESKAELLECLKKFVEDHPEKDEYVFYMSASNLKGERLTRDELDEIVPEKMLFIQESEYHSAWVNTPKLKDLGIDEYAEDISPGLSTFERDENGRVNGRIFEFCQIPPSPDEMPVEMFEDGIRFITEFWKKNGVVAGFDAGFPDKGANDEVFFKAAVKLDEEGELPIYIEACKYIFDPKQIETAISDLNRFNETYGSEHFKVRTMKMMLDGTHLGQTAATYEPYEGTDSNGGTLVDTDELCRFLLDLNENGTDFHAHTVGERAVGTVLDAVEKAKNEIGDDFRIQVTCAHVECIPDEMVPRFAELGVFANFTPQWFGGLYGGTPALYTSILGKKRAGHIYRANSIWNTGATVTFSCDEVYFGEDMKTWSPYMGMEVGMTRQDDTFLTTLEDDFSGCPVFPGNEEKLSLAQMLRGFTINAAKEMRLDDRLGSIETGKDGSFLIFKDNLFDVNVYDIHRQLPEEVFFNGEKVN